jgi:homoserine kinase type II
MAVYTEVSFDEAAALIARLRIGELTALTPCMGGIENTNYFVDTTQGRYVLTLFERLTAQELPFYLHLMKHLAERSIPVPGPKADASGTLLHQLNGKPAAVVDRLPGKHPLAPSALQCAQVGQMLARMHLAGQDFKRRQPNLRGLDWWVVTVPLVLPHLSAPQRRLIESELAFQEELATKPNHAALPRGAIHADLFRDNAMFEGDRLTGLFDFYFAGIDTFVFDIAVCLNDWCIELATGQLDEARAHAFVAAYDAVRRLRDDETRLLPAAMRAAALRFWISRLWDLHLPRDAHVLQPHDPSHFERVLQARVDSPWSFTRTPASASPAPAQPAASGLSKAP